jgi:hypothetical protein
MEGSPVHINLHLDAEAFKAVKRIAVSLAADLTIEPGDRAAIDSIAGRLQEAFVAGVEAAVVEIAAQGTEAGIPFFVHFVKPEE